MATIVKLKNEGEKISMIGRETITSENLTVEKYLALISEYPSLASKFEVIDAASPDPKSDSSPANNE